MRDLTELLRAIDVVSGLGGALIRLHGALPFEGPDGQAAGWVCTCEKGEDCPSPGKHPKDMGWQHGPAASPAGLKEMLQAGSHFNVGWRMGKQPDGRNLLAIDVDDPEKFLAWIKAEAVPLPPTYMQRTARGGLHLVYSLPGDIAPGNAVVKGRGYDIRAEAGQIVLAGSRMPHGTHSILSTGPIVDLPPETFAALLAKADVPARAAPAPAPAPPATGQTILKRARAYIDKIPGAKKGERDSQAWKVALAAVKGFQLDPASALVLLQEWCARCEQENGRPWVPDAGAERLIDRAASESTAEGGYLLAEEKKPNWNAAITAPARKNLIPNAALWTTAEAGSAPAVLTAEICIKQSEGKTTAGQKFYRPLALGQRWEDLAELREAMLSAAMTGITFTPESVSTLVRLGPELAGIDAAQEYQDAVNRATATGAGLAGLQNVLSCTPGWGGAIRWNTRTAQVDVVGPLPVPRRLASSTWTDADTTALRAWFGVNRGATPAKGDVWDCVQYVAQTNAYDPVQEYLDKAADAWDGTPRLDTWLKDWMGGTSEAGEEYVRQVGRKWILSAVARTFEAGRQADYMLILVGAQGIRKSSMVRALFTPAGLQGSWKASIGKMGGKELAEILRGKWGIELAELANFRGRDVETIKQMITEVEDVYRPAYGLAPIAVKRTAVLIGTTNEESFLSDPTGARRFWPVLCTRKPALAGQDGGPEAVRQLWGEAVRAYRQAPAGIPEDQVCDGENGPLGGEDWWSVDDQLAEIAQEGATDQGTLLDPWWEIIDDALQNELDLGEGRPISHFMRIVDPEQSRWTKSLEKRLGPVLRRGGWEPRRATKLIQGRRPYYWFPHTWAPQPKVSK